MHALGPIEGRIPGHGHSNAVADLRPVIPHREMLNAAIVPKDHRARLPLEADLKIGALDVVEEEVEKSSALFAAHADDLGGEAGVDVFGARENTSIVKDTPYVESVGLGFATSWFDDTNLWEWQVVYEMRWDVSGCNDIDPSTWLVSYDNDTHSSPSKSFFELCSDQANLASLTIIKDTDLDNPWHKFFFEVQGPTPSRARLQDWGTNECPPAALTDPSGAPLPTCDNTAAWTYPDRVTFTDMIPTDGPAFGGALYSIGESPEQPDPIYNVSWQCKAINPACGATAGPDLDYLTCPADPAQVACDPGLWTGAEISGVGPLTDSFSLCTGGHVICEFTNTTGPEEICLESENAIGDLQVLGGVESRNVSFTEQTVAPLQADAPDSIFLSSFVPIADRARWPGAMDHFVAPLPVVEVAPDRFLPDKSVTCASPDDTACLAWEAAKKILSQAPDSLSVAGDRQIGPSPFQRRVTYSQDSIDDSVPSKIRAFDYSVSDAVADEWTCGTDWA